MPKAKKDSGVAIHPRQLRVGDLIPADNPEGCDVVSRVEVVATLGSGMQVIFQMEDKVMLLPQEELPDTPVERRPILPKLTESDTE